MNISVIEVVKSLLSDLDVLNTQREVIHTKLCEPGVVVLLHD